MQPTFNQEWKFEKVDGQDFLSKIYYSGFCDKKDDLPEVIHSVQKEATTPVDVKYIGGVFIVTGEKHFQVFKTSRGDEDEK